jgi:hypothetical protein
MKAILIFIMITLINYNVLSQDIQSVIDDLYSDNIYDPIGAITIICSYNITEAFDDISTLYDQKPPIVQHWFLIALQQFEDTLLYNRLIDYITRADSFVSEEYPLDPLTEKVHATYLLFSLGDYSTYNYVFELINRDGLTEIDPTAFKSLEIILNNIPNAEIEAKNILLNLLDNSTDTDYRYFSMIALVEKYQSEMTSRILNSFENDSYLPVRILALEYLYVMDYPELNALLNASLILDPEWSFRIDIADSLLISFGEPSDLKAVIDYQPNEPNETARSLMAYSIEDFIPPKPDTLNWSGLTTKLITFTDEMLQYGWIANQQRKDFYSSRLDDIISLINQTNEIDSACTIINEQLLPQAEQDLQQELITTEGYKFLHYYTVYIKEEIEEDFGLCP